MASSQYSEVPATNPIANGARLQAKGGNSSRRFDSLDSLRGIAALIVVFAHFSTLFDQPHAAGWEAFRNPMGLLANNWMFLLKMTPLSIVMQGHASVVLFFLLSGFVLAIPFTKEGAEVSTRNFLFRRMIRIYPPYFAALVLAILCDLSLSTQGIAEMSPWFNRTWNRPVGLSDIVSHILFIGDYDNGQYNTAFWSLIYEMRVSLIYPMLFFIVAKMRAAGVLILSVGLIVVCTMAKEDEPGLLYTVAVIGMFAIGSLIYLHREALIGWHAKLSGANRGVLLLISLLGFGYSASTIRHITHRPLAGDLLLTLFAGEILILAICDGPVQRFLHHRYCVFLGKISYSLYLTHATVIFSAVYLAKPFWNGPNGAIWWPVVLVICLFLSLGLASVFYEVIELPSSRWSRHLSFYRKKHAGDPPLVGLG